MPEYQSIKEDILKKLQENLSEIENRFGIDTIGIFGSVSREEDTETSDVDVLYRFKEEFETLQNLVNLNDYLVSLFGREIDLIPIDYLTPVLKPYIQRDAILYGSQPVIA